MPPERDLAERFGVSRPTIRRAVAVLERSGRIRTRHGSGMTVCGPRFQKKRSATIAVMGMFNGERLRLHQNWLLRRGFMLCAFSVAERDFDPAAERLFLEQVRREKHHGLVAFCSPLPPVNSDLLQSLALEGTRVVHIAPFRLARPDQEHLMPDFEATGRMAGECLKETGCQAGVFVRMSESPYELEMALGFRKVFPGVNDFVCPPNVLSHPPARAQVTAFLTGLPAGSAVFCRSRGLAAEFVVLQRECAPGRAIHLIAADQPDCGISPRTDTPFDRLVIASQQERTERALDLLVRPDAAPVRELLEPTWVPAETTTGRTP